MKRSPNSRPPEPAAGVTLNIRVQPRASKNGMELREDGTVKVRLTAPPVDGAANEALVRYLADAFGVGRSQVEILSGQTGRQKIVRIAGMSEEVKHRVLNGSGD